MGPASGAHFPYAVAAAPLSGERARTNWFVAPKDQLMQHGWHQIHDAPLDLKLTLEVRNDAGDVYLLPFGCVRTANGFTTEKGTYITVTPLRWRAYYERRPSAYSRPMKTAPVAAA